MVADFLASPELCFDVRSPVEYNQGHIPGAINLPLFTDSERAEVGTAYKRQGQSVAIALGVKIVGPKLFDLLGQAKTYLNGNDSARLYCFRGGMRSGFVSWFLNFTGLKTTTLKGGYKAFRRFALRKFQELQEIQLLVLGGFTGAGKTKILQELQETCQQVIDLEKIAHHRGSSFGLIPGEKQPSCEQFENELAFQLEQLDYSKPIWVEDESRLIGSCTIPNGFFDVMKNAPLIVLECQRNERVRHIKEQYGSYPVENLLLCSEKIGKRLGSERLKIVRKALLENDLDKAIDTLLQYYDATYQHALIASQKVITTLSKDAFYEQFLPTNFD